MYGNGFGASRMGGNGLLGMAVAAIAAVPMLVEAAKGLANAFNSMNNQQQPQYVNAGYQQQPQPVNSGYQQQEVTGNVQREWCNLHSQMFQYDPHAEQRFIEAGPNGEIVYCARTFSGQILRELYPFRVVFR